MPTEYLIQTKTTRYNATPQRVLAVRNTDLERKDEFGYEALETQGIS